MIGISRTPRRGPGRFLVHKVVLLFAGGAVFIAGALLQRENLVLLAIPILAVGVALRFFEREPEPDEPEDAGDGDGEVGEGGEEQDGMEDTRGAAG